MSIPVYRPTLKRRDMDAVLTCMVSDEIGPGSLAEQFSKEVARFLNKEKRRGYALSRRGAFSTATGP